MRTFLAEIVVPNDDGIIRAGLMGNANILRAVIEDAILIPINAIIEAQKGRSIYIALNDNTAEERLIELGKGSTDTMAIITSGVSVGEKVIVRGQHDLVTGERINITGEYTAEKAGGFSE